MTTYRVGPDGATVFNEDGAVVCRLRPGHVVVPGMAEDERSPAAQHAALSQRRLAGYADKRLRDYGDKAAP